MRGRAIEPSSARESGRGLKLRRPSTTSSTSISSARESGRGLKPRCVVCVGGFTASSARESGRGLKLIQSPFRRYNVSSSARESGRGLKHACLRARHSLIESSARESGRGLKQKDIGPSFTIEMVGATPLNGTAASQRLAGPESANPSSRGWNLSCDAKPIPTQS